MNLLQRFRNWTNQWPEGGRWAIALWLGCISVVGFVGWEIYQEFRPTGIPTADLTIESPAPVPAVQSPPVDRPKMESADADLILDHFPCDPAAWSLASELCLATEPQAALRLAAAAAEAEPDSSPIRKDLAAACWATGDPAGAQRQIALLPEPERATILMRIISGAADQALNLPDAGTTPSPTAVAATIRAGIGLFTASGPPRDAAAQALARTAETVGPYQTDTSRLLARWLKNPDEARHWAQLTATLTGAVDDQIYSISLLPISDRLAAEAGAGLARSCAATPADALLYLGNLMLQDRVKDALDWLDGLPAPIKGEARLRARRASLLGALHRFDELKSDLLAGAWGPAEPDAIEFAFGSRLAAQRDQQVLHRDLWRLALNACNSRREAMTVVLRLAQAFGFHQETAESFEALLLLPPGDSNLARQYAGWARRQNDPEFGSRAMQWWRKIDPDQAERGLEALRP